MCVLNRVQCVFAQSGGQTDQLCFRITKKPKCEDGELSASLNRRSMINLPRSVCSHIFHQNSEKKKIRNGFPHTEKGSQTELISPVQVLWEETTRPIQKRPSRSRIPSSGPAAVTTTPTWRAGRNSNRFINPAFNQDVALLLGLLLR